MKGLQELIQRALVLMAHDEDFEPCCRKSGHYSEALVKAMEKVAFDFHVEKGHERMFALITSFAGCDAFPCREFR